MTLLIIALIALILVVAIDFLIRRWELKKTEEEQWEMLNDKLEKQGKARLDGKDK